MTSLKNQLSALAVNSLEIARLRLRIARNSVRLAWWRLRIARTAVRLAFLRLLIALVRAGISLGRRISALDTPPPPTNDPCTPGK